MGLEGCFLGQEMCTLACFRTGFHMGTEFSILTMATDILANFGMEFLKDMAHSTTKNQRKSILASSKTASRKGRAVISQKQVAARREHGQAKNAKVVSITTIQTRRSLIRDHTIPKGKGMVKVVYNCRQDIHLRETFTRENWMEKLFA